MSERLHENLVHSYMLRRQARERPDALFAVFPEHGGETWTFLAADRIADQAANFLAGIGVRRGDPVALFHEASPDYFRVFLGALRLGAVPTPLNDGFRGGILGLVLALSRAKVILAGAEFVDRLGEVELAHVETIIAGADAHVPAALSAARRVVAAAEIAHAADTPPTVDPIRFFNPYAIVFTSGTTGPSKAVLSCYGQIHATLKDNMLAWVKADDVFHVDVPIFHISGLLAIYTALTTGCRLIVYPKFRATEFWNRVRDHGATVATIVVVDFLWRQPPTSRDRDHKLRLALTGMFPPYSVEWQERFGLEGLFQFYNMSEISAPIQSGVNPTNRRAAGRARPGVELRIVDEHDLEVPEGEVGELIVRTEQPWETLLGYLHDPAATAAAWRNGWFHTGDAFHRDAEGYYYFVDRLKDSIKRRGENVSSYEVEREILAHPAIEECAVVAAPGQKPGDDEVHAFVAAKAGMKIDPAELSAFLSSRMARFMLPRYIDVLDMLPRNATTKIMKKALRERGVTEQTWDREAHRPRA